MAKVADSVSPAPEKPKKKKGFFRRLLGWIFWMIVFFLVVGAILATLIYRVPQKLGLMPNAAERHLMTVPDRVAGQAIFEEAEKNGMNMQGVSIFVFPYKEMEGSVAVVNLDAQEGFRFSGGGTLGAVGNAFAQVAGGQAAADADVEQVTLIYTSQKGEDIMSFAAPHEDILAFQSGRLTEEQFIASIAGDINLPAIIDEQIESLQNFMQ